MQQGAFQSFTGDFASGEQISGSAQDSRVVGQDLGFGFVIGAVAIFLGSVDDGDHKTFGFDLRRNSSAKFDIHDVVQYFLRFSIARYRFAGFFVGGLATLGFALVPHLLALGQRYLHFHPAVAEVQTRGDEGQSFLLGLADELIQFAAMNQQLSCAQRFVIEDVAVVIFTNVRVDEPQFAILDQAVSVLQVGAPVADGFDFGAAQSNSGLEFLEQEVIMRRRAIDCCVAQSAGCRIAPARLISFSGRAVDCGGRAMAIRYRDRFEKKVRKEDRGSEE